MNNVERRNAQMAYIADESVMKELMVCRRLLQKLNFMDRSDLPGIAQVVKELLGSSEGATINPPFYCDYGKRIHVGRDFFANYNCTIIDTAPVTIGDHCQLAPGVAIYTAGHPIHPATRNTGYEYGRPIAIGDNVWIGGNTILLPGVRIGSNAVIGAGSVVTRDIPEWTVAAGNPCRVIRTITDAERRSLYRGREIDGEAWAHICAINGWNDL